MQNFGVPPSRIAFRCSSISAVLEPYQHVALEYEYECGVFP